MSTTKRRAKNKVINKDTIMARTLRWQLCQNLAKAIYWSNTTEDTIKLQIKTINIIK